MQRDQHMHMIFHATDPIEMRFALFERAPDETVEIIASGFGKDPLSILGREHHVVEDLGVGGHQGRLAAMGERFAVQVALPLPWVVLAMLGRPMATVGEPSGFRLRTLQNR